MDDGLQQFLITEHNSCSLSGGNPFGGEPLTHVTGLNILRRRRDIGQFFRRLLFGILIEDSLASLFQPSEECLFHFLQMIESNKGIGVVTECYVRVFCHLSVEGTLITELLTCQTFVEAVIDRTDPTPELQEALFQFAVMIL